jgi:hypothetical protein
MAFSSDPELRITETNYFAARTMLQNLSKIIKEELGLGKSNAKCDDPTYTACVAISGGIKLDSDLKCVREAYIAVEAILARKVGECKTAVNRIAAEVDRCERIANNVPESMAHIDELKIQLLLAKRVHLNWDKIHGTLRTIEQRYLRA